jgi:hypothetical protein
VAGHAGGAGAEGRAAGHGGLGGEVAEGGGSVVVVVLLRGVGRAQREAGDRGDEADHRHDPGEDEVARVDVEAELAGDREPERRDDAGREQHEAHGGGGAAARGATAAGAAEDGHGPVGGLPVVRRRH